MLTSLFVVPAHDSFGANATQKITMESYAEYQSTDYELTFRGGTLSLEDDSLWLVVTQQPKGSLFEATDTEIRLWRLNSDGERTLDVSLATRTAVSSVQADSLFPIPINVTESRGVVLVVGGDAELHLKVFSPNGEELHNSSLKDFPEFEQFGRALLSIRSLSQDSALMVTPQMLAVVTYDGRRRAVTTTGLNEIFLDAVPVNAEHILVLSGIAGEASDRPAGHGIVNLRLLRKEDLSLSRTSQLTSEPVSLLTARLTPLTESKFAVVTEIANVVHAGESTWRLHVLDKDANIMDSRPLEPVPAGHMTTRFASIGRQNSYYIVGTLNPADQTLWIGLFDRHGVSIDTASIVGKTEKLLAATSFGLLPHRDKLAVFVPMTIASCATDCRRVQSGIRVNRLTVTPH